jgi:hypothetical protein
MEIKNDKFDQPCCICKYLMKSEGEHSSKHQENKVDLHNLTVRTLYVMNMETDHELDHHQSVETNLTKLEVYVSNEDGNKSRRFRPENKRDLHKLTVRTVYLMKNGDRSRIGPSSSSKCGESE